MSSLEPDALPATLVEDASRPPRIVAFDGFLGESHTAGSVRLYLDEELREWFDVAGGDILHAEHFGEGMLRRTVLWVDQRTTLERRRPQPEDVHGEYLDGELAAETVPQTAAFVATDYSVLRRTPMKTPYCY